eukprot:TRINITY_DN1010_c0_g1_i1.p1 TRINITY_DN1010_c0_g1~~TRINITY_DN1010_c0_g1_i1.p1  ORF type:complete len:960 (-),score=222.88 TRINITY_DN1010_c0_g1_i1:408-3287(-)
MLKLVWWNFFWLFQLLFPFSIITFFRSFLERFFKYQWNTPETKFYFKRYFWFLFGFSTPPPDNKKVLRLTLIFNLVFHITNLTDESKFLQINTKIVMCLSVYYIILRTGEWKRIFGLILSLINFSILLKLIPFFHDNRYIVIGVYHSFFYGFNSNFFAEEFPKNLKKFIPNWWYTVSFNLYLLIFLFIAMYNKTFIIFAALLSFLVFEGFLPLTPFKIVVSILETFDHYFLGGCGYIGSWRVFIMKIFFLSLGTYFSLIRNHERILFLIIYGLSIIPSQTQLYKKIKFTKFDYSLDIIFLVTIFLIDPLFACVNFNPKMFIVAILVVTVIFNDLIYSYQMFNNLIPFPNPFMLMKWYQKIIYFKGNRIIRRGWMHIIKLVILPLYILYLMRNIPQYYMPPIFTVLFNEKMIEYLNIIWKVTLPMFIMRQTLTDTGMFCLSVILANIGFGTEFFSNTNQPMIVRIYFLRNLLTFWLRTNEKLKLLFNEDFHTENFLICVFNNGFINIKLLLGLLLPKFELFSVSNGSLSYEISTFENTRFWPNFEEKLDVIETNNLLNLAVNEAFVTHIINKNPSLFYISADSFFLLFTEQNTYILHFLDVMTQCVHFELRILPKLTICQSVEKRSLLSKKEIFLRHWLSNFSLICSDNTGVVRSSRSLLTSNSACVTFNVFVCQLFHIFEEFESSKVFELFLDQLDFEIDYFFEDDLDRLFENVSSYISDSTHIQRFKKLVAYLFNNDSFSSIEALSEVVSWLQTPIIICNPYNLRGVLNVESLNFFEDLQNFDDSNNPFYSLFKENPNIVNKFFEIVILSLNSIMPVQLYLLDMQSTYDEIMEQINFMKLETIISLPEIEYIYKKSKLFDDFLTYKTGDNRKLSIITQKEFILFAEVEEKVDIFKLSSSQMRGLWSSQVLDIFTLLSSRAERASVQQCTWSLRNIGGISADSPFGYPARVSPCCLMIV